MKRFAEARAEEVFRNAAFPGVPSHIARRGRWLMHLLVAAQEWDDVGVIAKDRVARFTRTEGLFGVQVEGKWFVTFMWIPPMGVMEIGLTRR